MVLLGHRRLRKHADEPCWIPELNVSTGIESYISLHPSRRVEYEVMEVELEGRAIAIAKPGKQCKHKYIPHPRNVIRADYGNSEVRWILWRMVIALSVWKYCSKSWVLT